MENHMMPVGKDILVAVAVKKGNVSQAALIWTIANLLPEGHTVTLVHIRPNPQVFNKTYVRSAIDEGLDTRAREIFLPFQSYCKRKKVQSKIVILENDDVITAIYDFVLVKNIDVLVMGTGSRKGVVKKLMGPDLTARVSKRVPYFCTLYAVGKGKLQFVKYALSVSQRVPEPDKDVARNVENASPLTNSESTVSSRAGLLQYDAGPELEFRSPLKDYGPSDISVGGFTASDSDISFVNSDSHVSDDTSYSWLPHSSGWSSNSSTSHSSATANNSDWNKWSSGSLHPFLEYQEMDELHRLRLELIKSKSKYTPSDEADDELIPQTSKLNTMNLDEEQRMKIMQRPQKSVSQVEGRRFMSTTSMTDIDQPVGNEESLKIEGGQGYGVYSTSVIEAATNFFSKSKMLGQGRYGRVYACQLDHTPVAVKVLKAKVVIKEKLVFQKEVEKLAAIRHPNLVLLLGACSENNSLVYEYMRNGTLEDQLYGIGDTPALSWQRRFCIAAEIGSALLFLHHAKSEPIVHQCLTLRNILLDYNLVAKLSDYGVAKLMDPSATERVTQNSLVQSEYASYMDPEYTHTGMLKPLSDVYSLGVVLLQMLTAKSPVGLTHKVQTAISTGTFSKILDPAVSYWPVEETLSLAKLALKCTEMRASNRPDLAMHVLPELNLLRKFATASMI